MQRLADIAREHAAAAPDSVALVDGEHRITFRDLHERSSRFAQVLLAAGVQPGDRVALLMRNSPLYFEAAFGVNKVNAAVVALNWRLAAPEIAAILADARPRVVVTDDESADLLPADGAWDGETPLVVRRGEDYEARIVAVDPTDPDLEAGDDQVALVLYSSGTTGRPKGIMLSNHNLSYIERMAPELFEMAPDDVHLVVSPMFHIGGFGTGLTLTSIGGRTVLCRDATPENILETIQRERVTHAFFVPAVIQRLVELTEKGDHDLSSLKVIAYGAAPMTQALLRRSFATLGCGFVGCYGMTETAGTVTRLPPAEHDPEGEHAHRLFSVGRPLDWAEVRVTDLDSEQEAEPGTVGEIWVRSDAVTAGYLNDPESTGKALADDGWLRTGDGAYRDEDGYFYLADRIKDMIISGGENVYPAEVENVLADHPTVAEVAVIGVPSEKWGETVKAVVVAQQQTEVDADELIAFARGRLAHYKCPTSVDTVDDLPRGGTGKVLKNQLRERYTETQPPSTESVVPVT